MLIDRKQAKNTFDEIISSREEWIYIIGDFGIGKSYFVKNVVNSNLTIYCEPNHNFEYWKEILNKIELHINDIVKKLLQRKFINLDNSNKLEKLSNQEKYNILEEEIINEINTHKAIINRFLGEYLSERYKYIVLDNLYKCDSKTYNWMINLLDEFTKNENCHVIAICDIDKHWSYKELESDLYSRFSRVKIEKYDDSQAFFDLINTVIHFDNSEMLVSISKKLYNDFNGSAASILNLISLIKKNNTINRMSDEKKEKFIIDKAVHLSSNTIKKLNYISKEILAILALSPIPLSSEAISNILECNLDNINCEIHHCLKNDLIERKYNKQTDITEYRLTNSFSIETYIKPFKDTDIKYFYEKIFRAHLSQIIHIENEQLLEIAIKCEADDIDSIASCCLKNINLIDSNISRIAELLNNYLSLNIQVPQYICTMQHVNLLYTYGYYQNAYKVICNIKNKNCEYEYLMKKGDIEHLILHPNTAKTFERAANLPEITTSQKLSAINRQIMALTQEKKNELNQARSFYKHIVSQYENEECDGLIELYRNSNNIFPYTEAIEYTIKGYNLSVKLNNGPEKLKNLHNICMLKVLNGNYYSDLNHTNLNVEPDFKMICNEFEEHDEFLHELSYPLLDLGTLEMFKFVEDTENNIKYLYSAKKYFSRAQIYAKSFYAKNIANTSLLIVNSYLHKTNEEYIISARKRIFENYSNEAKNIKDFRVHRKILFALATSASITNHFEEGRKYLRLSKPHVFEGETLRYNNLCDDLKIPNEKIEYTPLDPSKIREYHKNSKFVPWLISFGH